MLLTGVIVGVDSGHHTKCKRDNAGSSTGGAGRLIEMCMLSLYFSWKACTDSNQLFQVFRNVHSIYGTPSIGLLR
jgi:hypothetical protein